MALHSTKNQQGTMQNQKDKALVISGKADPYNGEWTVKQAAHLLRRTTFGPNKAMIDQAVQLGLESTLDRLFSNGKKLLPQPVKWTLDERERDTPRGTVVTEDPNVNYGDPWIESPIFPNTGDPQLDNQIRNYKVNSMYASLFLNMHSDEISLREKMLVFWHNHFVVGEFRFPETMYRYINCLHNYDLNQLNADHIQHVETDNIPANDHEAIESFTKDNHVLGNFKKLCKAITIDLGMLLYLNGNENSRQAPNENYARELLELFTIGKGDLAGPGDYTNYTEDDVLALAKILTGWSVTTNTRDAANLKGISPLVQYFPGRHDKSTKNLSNRLGNASISNTEHMEFSDLIDSIFEQDEVARHISRKLYRYFVYYNITEEVEQDIIQPMADQLISDDYEIEGALRLLLSSEHFFGDEAIGCMIKNPADYLLSITHGLNVQLSGNIYNDYYYGLILYQLSSLAEMSPFNHPDVAGWKAYYQSPQYYRIWLNSATLPDRTGFSVGLVKGGRVTIAGNPITLSPTVPVLSFLDTVEDGIDPNNFIHNFATGLLPYGLTESQKDYLKDILLGGQPDFVWTNAYSDYFNYIETDPNYENNPEFIDLRDSIQRQLREMLSALLEMPESQLM